MPIDDEQVTVGPWIGVPSSLPCIMRHLRVGQKQSNAAPTVWQTHIHWKCQYVPKGWSGQEEPKSLNTQRSQGPSRGATRHEPGRPDSVEICRLYNEQGAGCTYPACRFAHLCMRCHRPHPQFECGRPKGGHQ